MDVQIDIKKLLESLLLSKGKTVVDALKDQGLEWNGKEIVSIELEPFFKQGNWYKCIDFIGLYGFKFERGCFYQCKYDNTLSQIKYGLCSFNEVDRHECKEHFCLATEKEISESEYRRQEKGIENALNKSYKAMEKRDRAIFKVGDRIRRKGTNAKGDVITNIYESGGVTMYEFENSDDAPQSEHWELVEQKPVEWSEEDEEIRKSIIDRIERRRMSSVGLESAICENQIDWLKSLCPQSHWKPSDEQMDVLLSEVSAWTKGCPKQIVLESLYQDLKKLKG